MNKIIPLRLLHAMLALCCIMGYGSSCLPEPIQPATPSGGLRDTTLRDLPYGTLPTQRLDLGLPAGRTANTPLVVVIHGGGWSTGDKAELTFLLEGLKKRGFAVGNINYRLTLNSADNYAMQLDDVDSAVSFLLRQASTRVYNGTKVLLAGHSAGGHLSLSYAFTRNRARVRAAASLAGPTDLYAMAYYNFNLYNPILQPFLGMPLFPATSQSEQRYRNCSPRHLATASSPACIFFHGEMDPVVQPDQSSGMHGRLVQLGVPSRLISYPLTFHDWWTDAAKTSNTMDEMKKWFDSHY